MANIITQTCTHCGETKPLTSEFWHRNKTFKTGFLRRCKPCQNEKTTVYNRANPQYWKKYRSDNEEYIKDYYKNYYELDTCKIYAIVNPIGETYIGFTQHKSIDIRISHHKSDYKYRHGSYGKLHESFDKWTYEEHKVFLIEELKTKERDRGLARETFYIEHYMKLGKSLNMKTK